MKCGFTADGCRVCGGRRCGVGMFTGCRKRVMIRCGLDTMDGRNGWWVRSSASSFAAPRCSLQLAKPRRAGLSHISAAAAPPSPSPTSSASLTFPQFPVPTPLATACAARFARGIRSPFPAPSIAFTSPAATPSKVSSISSQLLPLIIICGQNPRPPPPPLMPAPPIHLAIRLSSHPIPHIIISVQ